MNIGSIGALNAKRSYSEFSKKIPLEKLPKYGWKTTPVTLEITYGDTVVKMKTEVHEKDEPKPEIIFSTSLSN